MAVRDTWKTKNRETGEMEPNARWGRGKRWEATWYDEAGHERSRMFQYEKGADEHVATMLLTPEDQNAQAGKKMTVAEMMDLWYGTKQDKAPKTLDAYRYDIQQINQRFRDRLASSVTPLEIATWRSRPGYSASVRRRAHTQLKAAYAICIDSDLLIKNPAAKVTLPDADDDGDQMFLTFEQLEQVSDGVGPVFQSMVWLMGTTGIRIAETAGLRVSDINPVKGEMKILRQRQGATAISLPKGGKTRTVPLTPLTLAKLPLAGRKPNEWLFRGLKGDRVDMHSFRERFFEPVAFHVTGEPMTPHDLRHTAASLLVDSGASIKKISNSLGHKNTQITVNLYTHLYDDMGEVSASMDELYRKDRERRGLSALSG